jgi:membrane-bound ClpP family serine protease
VHHTFRLIAQIILSLAGLFVTFLALRIWRNNHRVWLLLASVTALLAAFAFWLDVSMGAFLGIVALALLLFGLWTIRREKKLAEAAPAPEKPTGEL